MRIAVFVSGDGSTLQSLLDFECEGKLAPGSIELVVSNRIGVNALARAHSYKKTTFALDHRSFSKREDFDLQILEELHRSKIELVVLAGFMRILSKTFIDSFAKPIINTHPSLLPAFPGKDAPKQAIDHGVCISGCTIHFVDSGVDTGPIIAQAAVDVLPEDTPLSLHKRIQVKEKNLICQATKKIVSSPLTINPGITK